MSADAYDILAMGELLVDLIGDVPADGLAATERFVRRAGGSPANMARTAALTGARTALISCVGDDGLGAFLRSDLDATGVDTRFLQTVDAPTSTVLVSRTTGTPDFLAFRHADAMLSAPLAPPEVLASARMAHTTSFALSRPPARSAILAALATAAGAGAQITIDANFAPEIGPSADEARDLLREVTGHGAFVKVSDDDLARLFGDERQHADAIDTLHAWGAALVCLTRGKDGSVLSWADGTETAEVPVAPVEAVGDATGAGDAFWGGFLASHLAGADPAACARRGAAIAARKLETTGPLTAPIDLDAITL
jgi:fructokinase